jgi:hypothetical protein
MSVEATPEDRIGPAPDREEIIRVVRLYTDGFGSHRPDMYAEAFHPLARIAYTDPDGAFHEHLIADAFDGWANWDIHVTARIISVIQAGEVASVVLGFDVHDDPTQSWLDIHSLLRLDGTWKIINKTATHASRADWAGLGASGQATHTTD